MEKEMKEKTTKEKEITEITLILIVFIGFVFYLSIFSLLNSSKQILTVNQTFYLSSNLFPIEAYISYINGTPAAAIFYGTPQLNGTECISSVAVYLSNYTSQRISSTPLFIYNPKEVANIYYSSGIVDKAFIPNGYTLLCPNIVNATK